MSMSPLPLTTRYTRYEEQCVRQPLIRLCAGAHDDRARAAENDARSAMMTRSMRDIDVVRRRHPPLIPAAAATLHVYAPMPQHGYIHSYHVTS